MTWTYGGETLEQVITSATLTPYIGETPGESVAIKLPYTFPVDSKKSYILTYTTSLPEDAAVGADLSVTNTAWLGNWKAEYTIDGTVPGKTGLVKTFTGQGDGDAVESDLNWSSIITFPQGTLEAGTLDSIRYVDIIQDAVNEGWQLRAGTHYTTPELLQQLVAAPVDGYNQQAELKYGTDYTYRWSRRRISKRHWEKPTTTPLGLAMFLRQWFLTNCLRASLMENKSFNSLGAT